MTTTIQKLKAEPAGLALQYQITPVATDKPQAMKGQLRQRGLNVLPAPKHGNGIPHLHLPAKPTALHQAALVAAEAEAAVEVEAEAAVAEAAAVQAVVVHQEEETK